MQIFFSITGSLGPPDGKYGDQAYYCTYENRNVGGIPAIVLGDKAESEARNYGALFAISKWYAMI